jgi:two-component system, NarL family, response regulator
MASMSVPHPLPGIRLLCVDDHHLVREGLALIINRQPEMAVVATAASGEEGVALFRQHLPDVTVMDLRLPAMSGLDAVRAIRGEVPDARIIVLTVRDDDESIYQALQAGAAAYLLKDTVSDDLIRTIREVHAGHRLRSDLVEARLVERASRPSLTPRELEVVELMAQAMRNKEIAASLGLSEQTVQVHVKNIFAKLKVGDRIAAINVARHHGLIRTP